MKMLKYLVILGLVLPLSAMAQGVNYKDEAGNINFVERLEDVPVRYRPQIVKPTPTPDLSPRDQRKYDSEKRKALQHTEKIKKKAQKEKERAIAKEKKLLEKRRKRLAGLKG